MTEQHLNQGCDSKCPAVALVEWAHTDTDLVFCGHHSRRLEVALRIAGWVVSRDPTGVHPVPTPISEEVTA